jgi:competence ComEA-like helix-hairpin-helix protein
MKAVLTTVLPTALFAGFFIVAAEPQEFPEGKGKDLTKKICSNCHTPEAIFQADRDARGWVETVEFMITNGASIQPEEEEIIVNYLVRYFGPIVDINEAPAEEMRRQLGLSAKDAEAIVKARKESGRLKSLNDLSKIGGLDFASIEAMRYRLRY